IGLGEALRRAMLRSKLAAENAEQREQEFRSHIMQEISERKQTEHSLRILATIVESSDDAIISKDLDGRIVTWNAGAEKLFGYSAPEIIGRPITVLIPAESHSEEAEILA